MYACCARPVPVAQSTFVGEYQHVDHLAHDGLRHRELRLMLSSGQLLATRDGTRVARWTRSRDGGLHATSSKRVHGATFHPEHAHLFWLGEDLTVAGTLMDGRSGMFRLVEGEEVDWLSAEVPVAYMGNLALISETSDGRQMRRIFGGMAPQGYPVDERSLLSVLVDGRLLVLEPLADTWYRYIVSQEHGFEEFYPVPFPNATFVGLARWRDMTVVAVKTLQKTTLEFLGPTASHLRLRRVQLEGELECLWQSPTENGIAWLTRTMVGGRAHRRLFVNNELFVQGEFTMGPGDLAWSPSGLSAGVHIRRGLGATGMSALVSSKREIGIRPGRTIDEFVLDASGEIAAWIESDGRFCYPMVRGAPHDAVEMAWNLRFTPEGISYNCVMADVIQLVTDRTAPQN